MSLSVPIAGKISSLEEEIDGYKTILPTITSEAERISVRALMAARSQELTALRNQQTGK